MSKTNIGSMNLESATTVAGGCDAAAGGCRNGGPSRREALLLAGAGALVACGGTEETSPAMDMGVVGGMCGTDVVVATGAELLKVGEVKSFVDNTRVLFSFIVGRDAKGFYALRNNCPHAGCLPEVKATNIECPCHTSRFKFDGSLINGPAPTGLPSYPICRRGDGMLVVTVSNATNQDRSGRVQ